jgi:hypothetical protein
MPLFDTMMINMEVVYNKLKRDLVERGWDMIINNLPAGE